MSSGSGLMFGWNAISARPLRRSLAIVERSHVLILRRRLNDRSAVATDGGRQQRMHNRVLMLGNICASHRFKEEMASRSYSWSSRKVFHCAISAATMETWVSFGKWLQLTGRCLPYFRMRWPMSLSVGVLPEPTKFERRVDFFVNYLANFCCAVYKNDDIYWYVSVLK